MSAVLAIVITLVACARIDEQHEVAHSNASASIIYRTFEEALLESTDVVIVRYVAHRPFRETLIEFEFTVIDRILGNAADTIFVYASNEYMSIIGSPSTSTYSSQTLTFTREADYILVLRGLHGATGHTHEDGFTFINNLVINLDNPVVSTMYNEPLHLHATELDFQNNTRNVLMRSQVIEFISIATINNSPGPQHIRSDCLVDIVNGSPYVLVVEIYEPIRLVHQQVTRDWMETDIFSVIAIETLKGDFGEGSMLWMVFEAYAVQVGERHVITAERVEGEGSFFRPTSRNSLHTEDQLPEIRQIIERQQMYPYLIPHTDAFIEVEVRP